MATIYGSIKGITLHRENPGGGTGRVAFVSFELPAYTASSDNGQLGAGGFDRGAATTATLAAMIQTQRRDGKTVTLGNPGSGSNQALPTCVESGAQGATQFYAAGFAYSSGSVTFNLSNSSGTEIDAASGVTDRPIVIAVPYTLA
jgi:hypothetical protein